MASIRYLYNNRAKFALFSVSGVRAWAKRLLTFKELSNRNLRRYKLIKAGAEISPTAEIGRIKADGNKNNLKVGHNSFVGRVELALHDTICISDHVCINDGVKLLTASHDILDPEWKLIEKPILIDSYAWIATGAIILPGVKIGKGAVVGAGAVVSKDVEPYTVVAGNPAKAINKKRIDNLTYNPCEFLAANMAWLKG